MTDTTEVVAAAFRDKDAIIAERDETIRSLRSRVEELEERLKFYQDAHLGAQLQLQDAMFRLSKAPPFQDVEGER